MADFDFGFDDEKFESDVVRVNYAQFFNPKAGCTALGVGFVEDQAKQIGFTPDKNWEEFDHKFKGDRGTIKTKVYATMKPRMLVLREGKVYMADKEDRSIIIPYNRTKSNEGNWRSFSYKIVWFLAENNHPLHAIPVRLKFSGKANYTLANDYKAFKPEIEKAYSDWELASGKAKPGQIKKAKGDLFFAHAIYQPTLEEGEASNGVASSPAVVCTGHKVPTADKIMEFLIPPTMPELRAEILEYHDLAGDWVIAKTDEPPKVNPDTGEISPSDFDGEWESAITPEEMDEIPF